MQKALFSILSTQGHLSPCIKLARVLKANNIACIFTGSIDVRSTIIDAGFEFIAIQSTPFGIGLEESNNDKSYLNQLMNRIQKTSYKSRKADYQKWLNVSQPDFLFIDTFQSTDFIVVEPLIRNRPIRVIFIQTMFSTYNDNYTPPLNTFLLPSQRHLKWEWTKVKIQSSWQRIISRVKFWGFDNLSLIERQFRQNQLPTKFAIDRDKVFHVGFQNTEEWVLVPQELEFSNKPQKYGQKYIGLMTETTAKIVSIDFEQLLKDIEQAKKEQKKIIYASLGTLHEVHTKRKSILFFEQIIRIFENKPDCFLVLAVGITLKNKLRSNVTHIHIYENVPQKSILNHADVFMTHGGLNSVLESCWAGVPMVVYPLNNRWDQNGNAARVVYHGLGIKGKLNDSNSKIFSAVLSASKYKANALLFSELLQKKYADITFLDNFLVTELLIQ